MRARQFIPKEWLIGLFLHVSTMEHRRRAVHRDLTYIIRRFPLHTQNQHHQTDRYSTIALSNTKESIKVSPAHDSLQ